MNKNAKIALGCGGAGCLGLVLIVIIGGVLIFTGVIKAPGIYSPSSNSNYNSNYNYNYNSNTNRSANRNSSTSSSTMSEDDKHRLFQAASMTRDTGLALRAMKKIGIVDSAGTPTAEYTQFLRDHPGWGAKNYAFMLSINTPEKARAYTDLHMDN